jgi:hypothetical protein
MNTNGNAEAVVPGHLTAGEPFGVVRMQRIIAPLGANSCEFVFFRGSLTHLRLNRSV